MGLNRRNFIKGLGAAGAAGLAGCSSNDNDTPTDTETTETKTPEQDKPTQIEFLQSHDIQTLPIVTNENKDNQAGIRLEVEDQDGLEHIHVAYNDEHRNEPHKLYDKTKDEFEQGVNDEMVPISEEFPQRVLAPNTGEFQVKVTDVNGNTETRTETINGLNGSYRTDRKRKADSNADLENIGNYATHRNWDNLVTNTQQINQMQNEYVEQVTYTPLVNQIMRGEDFETGGNVYPNWEGDYDRGFFDQDAVKEEDDFETLIRWYLPAIMDHDDENYGNAPSSRNYRFAKTMQQLINQHHPSAEAQATNAQSLPAHGIFGVQDRNNEEFYLVDTTSSSPQFDQAVGRIGDFITSEDGMRNDKWDPFHEPYEGDATPTYHGKKREKMKGFTGFVKPPFIGDVFDQIFMTDEWMDDAYEILRNGGSIDPITEPVEEILYNAQELEDDTKIGIYGNLDDTRIAVTSGDEIYETVNYNEKKTPGIKEIEGMLEAA